MYLKNINVINKKVIIFFTIKLINDNNNPVLFC